MKTASRIKLAATVASVMRASTRPGAPSVAERTQAVPRLVRATLDGTYAGTTLKRLGLVAAAVAYVASPVDLLPEMALPVLGAADDAVVITWAIKAFLEETDRFIAWEMGQDLRSPTAQASADADARVWAGGVRDGLRRDRDTTGAAARGRMLDRVTRLAAGARPGVRSGNRGASASAGSGLGADGGRLPEGVRQAATDYVLESVRKRLER
jgi:uncharacterized membrane protein YkvA (DUF1232 family)